MRGDLKRGLDGRFSVAPTTPATRRDAGADYVACVNADVKRELGLGRHIVAFRCFDNGETPPRLTDRPPVLRARCRLATTSGDAPARQEVLLDQTVRNAIGIPFRMTQPYRIGLAPLHRGWWRDFVESFGNRLLRRRLLFMRVCSADPGDMEKQMARIPADAFPLLGATPGAKVVIIHPVWDERGNRYFERRLPLQAYALTEEIVERRRGLERPGLYERYPDAAALLDVVPDLACIYLDQQVREELDLRSLEVVMVRRDDRDAFLQRIRSFGLTVVVAAIAIVGVFPIHQSVGNGVLVVLSAVIAASAISVASLRVGTSGPE